MPRPSSNPDKARSGSGVEAGNYEVIAAKYQNIKTERRPNQPNLVLVCATLDKDAERVRGADPVDIYFALGEKSLEAFHPGQCSGPDDPSPKDQGDAVDAEGNTIYCSADEQFSRSCSYIVFCETLTKAGYPKSVLDQTYAPNFVGLKFELQTRESKAINDKFGTRLNTRPMADGGIVSYKVCEKWLNPQYLTNGQPSAATAKQPSAPKPEAVEDIAKAVLADVAKQKPGEKNKIKTKQSLVGFFTNAFAKAKMPQAKLSGAQELVKSDEWIAAAVAELGGSIGYNDEGKWDGTVTFAE